MGVVVRLAAQDEPTIERLLRRDEVVNLFPIGFLAVHPVERAWWYGVGEPLRGVVLVLPGRLAVPYAPDPRAARQLGEHLAVQHRPCMLVGPRATCDALWACWGRAEPTRFHDQALYVIDRAPPGDDPPGFRAAILDDWPIVARHAVAMELEDLGTDPSAESPKLHEQVVQERVRAGRTFVIARDGGIVFQVNVGTTHALGCQIGGTWVPPAQRGRGLATRGVAATCRRLLARYPRVTLHVNEANRPAVRVYEKVGFRRYAAFRLLIP